MENHARYGRLPWLAPADYSPAQRSYYEQLTAGPRPKTDMLAEDGRLKGPFNARLLHPELGAAQQEVSAILRFGTPALTDRQRELTILETARHERANYEWVSHAKIGLNTGLTKDEIEHVQLGGYGESFAPLERLTREVTQALLQDRDLDDELYERAERELGLEALFDIVALVGHYQQTALATRVWRVPPKDGAAPVFDE
jgi:4-carboxymuconolactone decarboxylase